jgi:hypothetical protein
MVMARCGPGESELLVINEAGFLKSEDGRLCDLIFNAPGFKVSEKLALTFRTSNERIERNCIGYFVRV